MEENNNNQGVMLDLLGTGEFFHSLNHRGSVVTTPTKEMAEKFNSEEEFYKKYELGEGFLFVPLLKILTVGEDYTNPLSDIYDLKLDEIIKVANDCGEPVLGAVMTIDNWRKVVGIWNSDGKYSEHNIDKVIEKVFDNSVT